jgi:hypothetical protein
MNQKDSMSSDISHLGGEELLRQLKGARWSLVQKICVVNQLWKEKQAWFPKKEKILHQWIRWLLLKSIEKSDLWFETAHLNERCWTFFIQTLEYYKYHPTEAIQVVNIASLLPVFTAFFQCWAKIDSDLLKMPRKQELDVFKQVVTALEMGITSFEELFKPTMEAHTLLVEAILLVVCRFDLQFDETYVTTLMNILMLILNQWNYHVAYYANAKKVSSKMEEGYRPSFSDATLE